jgi:hypothetical protein
MDVSEDDAGDDETPIKTCDCLAGNDIERRTCFEHGGDTVLRSIARNPLSAQAIDELRRCSLIDNIALSQGRVILVSLAREARLHQLSKVQREQIEECITDLYARWLYELQQYQDDADTDLRSPSERRGLVPALGPMTAFPSTRAGTSPRPYEVRLNEIASMNADQYEQAALIAELVILYIKQRQFLKAGELLVTYGWLCTQLGYMSRIERYASTVRLFSTSSLEEDDGRALLYYQIMVLTGKNADAQARQARQAAYRRLHLAVQQGTLRLQPHSELMMKSFKEKWQP